MKSSEALSFDLNLPVLVIILLALPVLYLGISYAYLAVWHGKLLLFKTVIHENGRHTLLGSLFYFDHFVACVPMVIFFALCVAGGLALSNPLSRVISVAQLSYVTAVLLLGAALLVLCSFVASVFIAGWQRTVDYASQRIERDGVTSKGGNWNQLQLSNVPIGLGAIGTCIALVGLSPDSNPPGFSSLVGLGLIGLAAILSIAISAFNWCGWEAFRNPRWLAHSIREMATYPFTGIPLAMLSVLLVEFILTGSDQWTVQLSWLSVILIGAAALILIAQLLLLKNTNISAIAQKPSFAPNGLTIPYLLCSHVFEHFLDFILIFLLAGGFYALGRLLSVCIMG